MKLLSFVVEPYIQDPRNREGYIIRGMWQKNGIDRYFSVIVDDAEAVMRNPLWWDDMIQQMNIAFKSAALPVDTQQV